MWMTLMNVSFTTASRKRKAPAEASTLNRASKKAKTTSKSQGGGLDSTGLPKDSTKLPKDSIEVPASAIGKSIF